ncbi:MAG: hypothetical protein ACOCX5_02280 [Chloroflexota bacterium]
MDEKDTNQNPTEHSPGQPDPVASQPDDLAYPDAHAEHEKAGDDETTIETGTPSDVLDTVSAAKTDPPDSDDDLLDRAIASGADFSSLEMDPDIEAALASVSALSDVIAEREAEEAAERARQEAEQRRREEEIAQRQSYYLPRPPMLNLQRGQLSSVIPALLLMLLGGLLTVALASPDEGIGAGHVLLVAVVGLGVILVAQWLSSDRWAVGALFAGVTLLTGIGITVFLVQTDGPGANGWPLYIGAVGAGALISALFSQPSNRYQGFAGFALIIVSGLGYAVMNSTLIDTLEPLTPVLVGAALGLTVLLIVLPLLAHRQGEG